MKKKKNIISILDAEKIRQLTERFGDFLFENGKDVEAVLIQVDFAGSSAMAYLKNNQGGKKNDK